MRDLRGRAVLGRFAHAPTLGSVEIWAEALVVVDSSGTIEAVIGRDEPGYADAVAAAQARDELVRLPASAWVLPGFVDLHVHAPQYPQLGAALDRPLEEWLLDYTFPLEARYADVAFAHRVYSALVDDLLAVGTTTALMFATVHAEATRALVDLCLERGLRGLVGKVAMDDPAACPDYYRDASAAEAVEGTRALIEYVRSHPGNRAGLVAPVVTPRFVPSCTDAALEGLGELTRHYGCHVQTHCSESDWEDGFVLARTGRRDAEHLDAMGLITDRTVVAHGVFLTDGDLGLLARRGSGVAHCALSNAYFGNAVFPLRAALARGVHVGLGTDISGGPSASMLEALRMTVAAARMLETGVDADLPPERRGRPGARVDWQDAFHLATAGGGEALGLAVGRFEVGYAFDAQLIDPDAAGGTVRLLDDAGGPEGLLARILYTASKPNVAEVWVAGRSVAGG